MKKTFSTSQSKDELKKYIKGIRINYSRYAERKEIVPIKFIDENRLRVSNGRATTYWRVNIDEKEKIIVERCITIMDWITMLTLVALDLIIVYLVFYGGASLKGIIFMVLFILCEFLPLYYLYVLYPMKKIEVFINKYLGGYE